MIGEQGRNTKRCLESFLEKKKLEPMEWQGARIPIYRRWVSVRRQIGSGEIYLVGDAAAQMKVSTVGGIVTGFRGALAVAQALLRESTRKELRALRRELATHWMIRRALICSILPPGNRWGKFIATKSTCLLWNLARRQPRLLLLGLRGLLMGKRIKN